MLPVYFLPYLNPTCKIYSTVNFNVLGSRHDGLSDVTMYFQVQYGANLPNTVTGYSRDPLNLKLKSQHLNIGKTLTTCTFTVLKKLGIST